jgi:hypothetical protein
MSMIFSSFYLGGFKMLKFDKVKRLMMSKGVQVNIGDTKILSYIIDNLVYNAKYIKDYLQVIEIQKEKNNILKITIKQEEVDDQIKENSFEFKICFANDEVFENINIKKMFLIENGERYEGEIVQNFILLEEY